MHSQASAHDVVAVLQMGIRRYTSDVATAASSTLCLTMAQLHMHMDLCDCCTCCSVAGIAGEWAEGKPRKGSWLGNQIAQEIDTSLSETTFLSTGRSPMMDARVCLPLKLH